MSIESDLQEIQSDIHMGNHLDNVQHRDVPPMISPVFVWNLG